MSPFLLIFTSFTSFLVALLNQFSVVHLLPLVHAQQQEQCRDEKCGSIRIPFPFYLNPKTENKTCCGSFHLSDAFHLSCLNSSKLYLTIASHNYRVLHFFSDGVLVDFPNTSWCHGYNDLQSFSFSENEYFSISADNVVALYDCEDSSLCKEDCERSEMPGCDDYGWEESGGGGGGGGGHPGCCYPLSDHSAWHVGDSFSIFSQFGCRGFSSWAVLSGSKASKRGVKLEWAVPKNSSKATCANNADIVNATSVRSGIRCQCPDGFVGDGFAMGVGCLTTCVKDGKQAYGKDCYVKSSGRRKAKIVAGVLTSAFTIAFLTAMLCLLKRPTTVDTFESDQIRSQHTISFRKVYRTQPFPYHELKEATKGFDDGVKLSEASMGTLYAGTLVDGSHIAVQKVDCKDERDLIQVLSFVEVLSSVSHKNMARLLGWSVDSCYTPLVVYEYPANGTLDKHLKEAGEAKISFDWHRRLNVAAETSSLLAFLRSEFSPPIFHHNLQSGCIFLDEEWSSKISGFELLNTNTAESEGSRTTRSDVYSLGLVLLELITGGRSSDHSTTVLQKIRSGKLEEIVDPCLYYHEQPAFRREQMEIVADLATRCLLYGADGKLGMEDVARELAHIMKESVDGSSRRRPALEETFSNSSLLQMISMSPDSLYVPRN